MAYDGLQDDVKPPNSELEELDLTSYQDPSGRLLPRSSLPTESHAGTKTSKENTESG